MKKRRSTALTVVFSVISVVYIVPLFIVLMNSFYENTAV